LDEAARNYLLCTVEVCGVAVAGVSGCLSIDRCQVECKWLIREVPHNVVERIDVSWDDGGECDVCNCPVCYRELKIITSKAFRRLAGKTQVYVFPDDHQRTRLTHSIEVATIAKAIARELDLNPGFAFIAGLAHDIGHGPAGHASEDVFGEMLGYWHHAVNGGHIAAEGLLLDDLIVDAIKNHSWDRPAPYTQEGACVRLADRIAYVIHDMDDAIGAGIISAKAMPLELAWLADMSIEELTLTAIRDVVLARKKNGVFGMTKGFGQAIDNLRAWLRANVYTRPEALSITEVVKRCIRKLVEQLWPDEGEMREKVVRWVSKLTDPYLAAVIKEYDEPLYRELTDALRLSSVHLRRQRLEVL
jgi:putative nucleotidyltransferase with HDIG domain